MRRCCTVFFIPGLVSWKVLAVSSHASYLNRVYNWTDRHKWLYFGGFMMKLGRTQRCCWIKWMHRVKTLQQSLLWEREVQVQHHPGIGKRGKVPCFFKIRLSDDSEKAARSCSKRSKGIKVQKQNKHTHNHLYLSYLLGDKLSVSSQ